MVTDPVCGMEIDPQGAYAVREVGGQTVHFCSADCLVRAELPVAGPVALPAKL